jgi:hypothetical protein
MVHGGKGGGMEGRLEPGAHAIHGLALPTHLGQPSVSSGGSRYLLSELHLHIAPPRSEINACCLACGPLASAGVALGEGVVAVPGPVLLMA